MLVARIMEFTGNTDVEAVKELTTRLSVHTNTITITFLEKPEPVKLEYLASEDDMRDIWWRGAVAGTMSGEQDMLKDICLMLHAAGLLDPATCQRLAPLMRPASPAGRKSPLRRSQEPPAHAMPPLLPPPADPNAAPYKDPLQIGK